MMKVLYYFLQLAVAIPLNIAAFLFAEVICLAMNKETGLLPKYLSWFAPPDTDYNGVIGGCYDAMWIAEHSDWSLFKCAATFIRRNPAYGYNLFCAPDIKEGGDETDFITRNITYGNIDIADGEGAIAGWYLITIDGWWNLSFVWQIPFTNRCMRGDYGWNLKPYVAGYESVMRGALQVTFVRFYEFGIKGN